MILSIDFNRFAHTSCAVSCMLLNLKTIPKTIYKPLKHPPKNLSNLSQKTIKKTTVLHGKKLVVRGQVRLVRRTLCAELCAGLVRTVVRVCGNVVRREVVHKSCAHYGPGAGRHAQP